MAEGGGPEAENSNFGRTRCTISQRKGLRVNEGSGEKKECMTRAAMRGLNFEYDVKSLRRGDVRIHSELCMASRKITRLAQSATPNDDGNSISFWLRTEHS